MISTPTTTIDISTVDSFKKDDGFLVQERSLHRNAVLTSSVQNFVSGVLTRAGGKKIRLLKVFGHGNVGLQAVGGGQSPNFNTQVIYLNNKGALVGLTYLSHLRGHFASNALVQLHGCDVGQGTKGKALLRALGT